MIRCLLAQLQRRDYCKYMHTTAVQQKITDFFTSYPMYTYDKRHTLLVPDEPLSGIFYITEGMIAQYDIAPSGAEVVVNIFKPGAFFPMSWAINRTPNAYFFEAATRATVHRAPVDDTLKFLQDNPDVIFDLLARVYRGTDGLLRRMAHLMGGDAESRLQFELLNAAYRFGEQQQELGKVLVSLSESSLAKHSGLARETVSRTMQTLKAAGLVETLGRGSIVVDVSRVEQRLGRTL